MNVSISGKVGLSFVIVLVALFTRLLIHMLVADYIYIVVTVITTSLYVEKVFLSNRYVIHKLLKIGSVKVISKITIRPKVRKILLKLRIVGLKTLEKQCMLPIDLKIKNEERVDFSVIDGDYDY
jgi:hypothetical protein